MNKDETLTLYRQYITNEKNRKKFNTYYFYEDHALNLLQQIIEADKDRDELSEETLQVIRLLCKKCSPHFDKSATDKNYEQSVKNNAFAGINRLLYEKDISDIKKAQLFREFFSLTAPVGSTEYVLWVYQALETRNKEVMRYFLDEHFSGFIIKKGKGFYEALFECIDVMFEADRIQNNGTGYLEEIKMLHFLFQTAETFFDEAFNEYIKRKKEFKYSCMDEDGIVTINQFFKSPFTDKELTRLEFIKMQKKFLFDFFQTKVAYACLTLAILERHWDYLDYCWERNFNKLCLIDQSDVLLYVVRLNPEKISLEEKTILLNHIIARAREQGSDNKLIECCDYRVFLEMAHPERKYTSLLRHALYSWIHMHNVKDGKNILCCLLHGAEKVSSSVSSNYLTTFLSCLDEKDKDLLLNPVNGVSPLSLCLVSYKNYEMFDFLLKQGARLEHSKSYAEHNKTRMNILAMMCRYNNPSNKEYYLDISARCNLLKHMVKYAEQHNIVNELLNGKGISPLTCVLADKEDEQYIILDYLIKHGATFNTTMLYDIMHSNMFSPEEKTFALDKLVSKVKEKELAPLFDYRLGTYSEKDVWNIVLALEKSSRNDKKACLYALFKYISTPIYKAINKRIASGESKKTITCSLKIMHKIGKSVDEKQNDYIMLHKSNVRYFDQIMKDKKEARTNMYERHEYLNLI